MFLVVGGSSVLRGPVAGLAGNLNWDHWNRPHMATNLMWREEHGKPRYYYQCERESSHVSDNVTRYPS